LARNFERTLLEAYAWLCTTYIPGDRIFLFGFSRGAYGVRIIADMIERTYMCTRGTRSADLKHAMELKCKIVKSDLSHAEVKVHFVGVWDTTSFGVVGFGSGAPETVKGMKHICHIRHALALDEKRVSYRQASAAESDLPEGTEKKYSGGNIKEVWFEGSHSDFKLNLGSRRFSPALRWMLYEALKHGLRLHPFSGECASFRATQSPRTGMWQPLRTLPLPRPSNANGKSRRQ
ncbi:hypothetical protein PLEOSDRAFT_36614, partial [Pleurotus ostreatus PC15]